MDFDCHKPGKSVTRLFRLYNLILNRRLRREVPHECYVRNNQTIVESETRWTHDVIELFRHSNRYKLALTLTCNGRWLFEGCAPSDSLTMLFQPYRDSSFSCDQSFLAICDGENGDSGALQVESMQRHWHTLLKRGNNKTSRMLFSYTGAITLFLHTLTDVWNHFNMSCVSDSLITGG